MRQDPTPAPQPKISEWLWPIVRSERTSYVLLFATAAGSAASGLSFPVWLRVVLFVAGGGCAVLEAYRANVVRARRRHEIAQVKEAVVQAITELHVLLGSLLVPIGELLAEIADTPGTRERRDLSGRLTEKVLDAASGICGPNTTASTRAVFFRLVGDQLEYVTYNGRGTRPRHALPADAVALTAKKESVMVTDVDATPDPNQFANASYKTFISCSVYARHTVFGLLTIDADEAHSLSQNDLRVAVLLAHLLGCGLAMANGSR